MRQIKFRVWDKAEKKWLFGYEYPNLGGFSLFGEVTLMGELSTISLDKMAKDEYAVMQHTGLKDKNGKEIYEGDILKLIYYGGGTDHLEVRYNENNARFLLFNKDDPDGWGWDYRGDVEVIGNIHENSDLLNS